jgi:hypothetical protein
MSNGDSMCLGDPLNRSVRTLPWLFRRLMPLPEQRQP